ncbi:hypothetical protein ASPFODRAFT_48779 [Aspergillus luchuensis CBS 106.47]|uniref:Uncharacterized protein n=1 Tax=Aspergillus luchuensis (strain CBS 106.47) TaxID=1137211 RepID=A0A1M3TD54_ASPLC|nr:hypothetical protein ASPFODRAFT_48779 [Aspergillus luchuensis CBS 106.47]
MVSLLGGSRAGEGPKEKFSRNVTKRNQSTLSLTCPEQVNQAVGLLRVPVTETLCCCLPEACPWGATYSGVITRKWLVHVLIGSS